MSYDFNWTPYVNKDIAEYLVKHFAKTYDYYVVGIFKLPYNNNPYTITPKTFTIKVSVGDKYSNVLLKVYQVLCKEWGNNIVDYFMTWFSLFGEGNETKLIEKLINTNCITITKFEDTIVD